MKKRYKILLSILLIISLLSMSSCYLSDLGLDFSGISGDKDSSDAPEGDTYINVEGGDNLNITINSTSDNNILSASKALLSSVSVYSVFRTNLTSFGMPTGETKKYATAGSGVIYKLDKNAGDAYIITNHHVVYDIKANTKNHISDDITVYLYGQQLPDYEIKATYVGGSMTYDLAVLKVDASPILMASSAVAADFANSDEVSVLDTAIAIGNPEGKGISATVGYVNVESEHITMLGVDNKTQVKYRVMRVDTAVNSGNSGGGLFNSSGKLIGIVNAKVVVSDIDNIGYAIPSNIVQGVCDGIIYYCDGTDNEYAYKCELGIEVISISSKAHYNTETGKVHIVEDVAIDKFTQPDLVRDKLQKNDIIKSITIDGIEYGVSRVYNVIDAMLNARVGSEVVISIVRGDKELDLVIPIVDKMLTECK